MTDKAPSKQPELPKVDLGRNSLLLIAIIVTVCSGSEHGSDSATRQKIDELQQAVTRLEKKMDAVAAATPAAPSKSSAPAATGTQP